MHLHRGFSLIELVVVIAIIAITSVMFFSGSRASRDQANLETAANDVAALISAARQDSVAVMRHPNPTPSNATAYPNYGIYFDSATPDKVMMYCRQDLDSNPNGAIDSNDVLGFEDTGAGRHECYQQSEIETITLKNNVQITNIKYGASTLNKLSILFVRPEPTIWFAGTDGKPLAPGTVEVTLTLGSSSVVVRVNSVGSVVTQAI